MYKLDRGHGPLQIWHMPRKDRMYSMGVDGAEGSANNEADNAAIQILDAKTGVQCAEWVSNAHPPMDTGTVAFHLGRFYGGVGEEAFAVVEENNHGHAIIDAMIMLGYRNFYVRRTQAQLNAKWTDKIGWMTSKMTKDSLVDRGRACYTSYEDLVNSRELRQELAGFYYVPKGTSGYAAPQALEGARDDRVMAWLMAMMGVRFAAGQLSVEKEPEPEPTKEQRLVERALAAVVKEHPENKPKRRYVVRTGPLNPWEIGF